MKYKFLKLLSIGLTISLLTPSLAFADSKLVDSTGSQASDINATEVTGKDTSQLQQSEYSDELTTFEDNETKVYVTKASNFSVIIPKTIILDGGETNEGAYSVKVKGDFGADEVIKVEPETSFLFKQEGKSDVEATVTQEVTTFQIGDDLVTEANIGDGVTVTGTVKVDEISAGSWVGSFKFNISLSDESGNTEVEDEIIASPASYFKFNSGTGTITGLTDEGKAATDIVIPSEIDDVVITTIGEKAFKNNATVTKVIIPSTVTSIESQSFYGCTSLAGVNIPDNVISIGDYAFLDCTALTSIVIPKGVNSIGNYAFSGCTGLTSINIPEGVKRIENYVFMECKKLSSVVIPEGATIIGNQAFYKCTNLTSVTIPDSVTCIGDKAFEGCKKLSSIIIPKGVTVINSSTFYGCTGLTSVDIPKSVTTIEDMAFQGCTSLNKVVIPESVTAIGRQAFYNCTGLKDINIPEGVISISTKTFYGCTGLTSVDIPKSVTTIEDMAFYNCSKLDTVNYTGTEEQWNAINIVGYNDSLTNATINYNYVIE